MMTREQITKILARCEAATEGPWCVNMHADVEAVNVLELCTPDDPRNGLAAYRVAGFPYSAEGSQQRKDAEFISEARTDVPELSHEVLRLMDELEGVSKLTLLGSSEATQRLLDHHVELRVLTELKLNEARLQIGDLKEALTLAKAAAANWEECWSAEIGHANRYKKERDEALATVEQMRKERDEALDTVESARDIVCLTTIGCGECQFCVALLAERQLTLELEEVKADRDAARAELAFIESEFAKPNINDLSQDALALKIEFAEVSRLLDAQNIERSLQGGPLSPAERVEILIRERDAARRLMQGSRDEVQRLTQERWETLGKQAEVIQKAKEERDEAMQELANTKAALRLLSEMFRDISMGSAR